MINTINFGSSPFLSLPAEDHPGSGGGSLGEAISRRRFLKRTSGATAATFISWHLSGIEARAEDPKKEGESDKKDDNDTIEVPAEDHVYRKTKRKQRKARSIVGSQEQWVTESTTISLHAEPDGDLPPPPVPPSPSDDHKVPRGWKESANDIMKAIKESLPAVGDPDTTYDPDENGEPSGSNDGNGSPPAGFEWTPTVREEIVVEKVPYTMHYRYSKK
jgi:hypothetical protein